MKFSLSLALLAALLMSACTEYEEPPPRPPARHPVSKYPSEGQYPVTQQPFNPNAAPPESTATPPEQVSASPTPPPPAAPAKARGDYPYGTPVPGKPGFVKSPFAPDQGLVDVRGFPPGTEVKDPFTGKIFLVP
jgi:hypothetical protein